MNNIFYIFMERYKKSLIRDIGYNISSTLEELEEIIKDDSRFKINRNEEGKMHSCYLGDRYEPAIIWTDNKFTDNYYLFDGDIKDCTHPYLVSYYERKILYIRYYSSERIKNIERVQISYSYLKYNQYGNKKILDEYEYEYVIKINNLEDFTLVCDEIDPPLVFKFAD